MTDKTLPHHPAPDADIIDRASKVAARVLSGWTIRPGSDPQRINQIAVDLIAAALQEERDRVTSHQILGMAQIEHLSKLLEEARCVYVSAEKAGVDVQLGHYRRLSTGKEMLSVLSPSPSTNVMAINPGTGRPLGDHGTANQAIDWVLQYADFYTKCQPDEFLRAWQHGDLDEWPDFYEWLSKQQSPQPMSEIKTSIDTMREAAWELLVQQGWKPGSQLSGHSAVGLIAEFGMRVYRGEVGCDYPDCGCGADAACADAVKQHPDLGGTPTPQPRAMGTISPLTPEGDKP